jgi:hypothetical protein
MVGLLAPSLAALILACLLPSTSRSAGPFVSLSARAWLLLVAAFVVELLLYNPPINTQSWALRIGPWLWLATKLLMLGIAIVHRRSFAWQLVALGLALNVVVIAANGGFMPQSTSAAIAVWGEERALAMHAQARLDNTVPMSATTRLNVLADVLPQPAWLPRANVVSIGDLLLSLGLACWTLQATRGGIVGMIGKPIHPGAFAGAPRYPSR